MLAMTPYASARNESMVWGSPRATPRALAMMSWSTAMISPNYHFPPSMPPLMTTIMGDDPSKWRCSS